MNSVQIPSEFKADILAQNYQYVVSYLPCRQMGPHNTDVADRFGRILDLRIHRNYHSSLAAVVAARPFYWIIV